MKTLHLSIMILSCFALLSVILSQNVAATVPLVEIMLSGTANNQDCENKCVISQTVTVQKGSAVEWINNDLIPYILASGKPEDKDNGTFFDSGQISVGKFFIHNFNDVGVYHYFERDHPKNTGIINVTDVTYSQSITGVTPLQTHDDNGNKLTIHNETGIDVTGKFLPPPTTPPEPPLKQFKSGIAANDVKCEQGLQLVIKAEDNSPACVKADTAQKLVERGWGWVMQTIDSLKPLMPNRIMGLENDTGLVTFRNQTYYFETPNYTDTAFTIPVQISFHDVIFTLFPSGFKGGLPTDFGGVATNGCGGSYFWTDAKFPDGIHELLHLFAITTMSQHCQVLPAPTDFSIHANPQAGLTFYDGKMKLLVNTNTLNSDMTSDHVVDLVSIKSVPPVTPGGPTIQITLKNNNAKPITSLNATLDLNNSYVFNFKNVTQLQPLTSGNSVYETKILIGAGFSSESTYSLTINGIADNTPFRYSENVTIPYTKKIVGNTTLHASFEPCDTPYPQSNTGIAVLYMPANSIGKICVRYHNLNDIPEKIFGISIYDPNNSNQNVTGVTTWSDSTDNTIPKGNSTVVYWVKTGNQTGIYAMELFCTGTPFAIGYDNNSKIVSRDFPWFGGTYYCPMQSYEFHIDSLSGIGVKYIPYP